MSSQPPILRQTGIRDVTFGRAVTVVQPANLYECSIGDDCFVGPFTEIQSDVTIGPRTRIQSHAFICSLVTIGADCFIGHGAKFVNDDFKMGGPAHGDVARYGKTVIEDHVSIGTNATLLPVRVVAGSVIGAGAVVTRDITQKGIYAGNPARLIRKIEP